MQNFSATKWFDAGNTISIKEVIFARQESPLEQYIEIARINESGVKLAGNFRLRPTIIFKFRALPLVRGISQGQALPLQAL